MVSVGKHGVKLSMALVLILGTSVPRFSMSHVHADGADASHHHHHEGVPSTGHSHDHDSGLGDHHTHFQWLCFEFQLPVERGEDAPAREDFEWEVDLSIGPLPTSPVDVFATLISSVACVSTPFDSALDMAEANLWAHRPPNSPRLP